VIFNCLCRINKQYYDYCLECDSRLVLVIKVCIGVFCLRTATLTCMPSIYCCLRLSGTGASFLSGYVHVALCVCVCVCVIFYIAFGLYSQIFYLSFVKRYVLFRLLFCLLNVLTVF